MPKFDVFGPLPHDPELTRLYDMVPGLSPLHALFTVHADALGHERVRMIDDRLVFADPADQLLACGLWRIVACGMNGHGRRIEITIPVPNAIPAAA
jgi:hypothetical protein